MKPLDGDMMSYFVSCLMAAIYIMLLSSHPTWDARLYKELSKRDVTTHSTADCLL